MEGDSRGKTVGKTKRKKHTKPYKGRKERLKCSLANLKVEKEIIEDKLISACKENELRRSGNISSDMVNETSFNHSAVVPSLPLITQISLGGMSLKKTIRHFSLSELQFNQTDLNGRGVFGKCFIGSVGPLKVCIKAIRPELQYKFSFYNEANLLSLLCHRNVSYLHGVCVEKAYPMIILNLITGHTLHSIIKHGTVQLTNDQRKKVVTDVISGLLYIHSKSVIHNDIKEDNIMIELRDEQVTSVLIDFGKACFVDNGKYYKLSRTEKRLYVRKHPQVSPDLRDGIRCQDTSDIYAFGRVLKLIYNNHLVIPALNSISELCLNYSAHERPVTKDLHTFLINLLS